MVSGIYRLGEVELAKRQLDLSNIDLKSVVIEVSSTACNPLTIYAVDSGFIQVKYLGLLIALINVAAVSLPGMNSKTHALIKVIDDEDIEVLAKLEELNEAIGGVDSHEVVLMDGPLTIGNGVLVDKLTSRALGLNHVVLSFSKEIRQISVMRDMVDIEGVGDASLALALFERYRFSLGRWGSVLLTKPVNIRRGVVAFYMQARPGSPPVYVEATENVLSNLGLLGCISQLLSRENYPIPLYLADKLAKVSGGLRRWVLGALTKVSSLSDTEPALLYRYIRDLMGFARDMQA